MSRGSMCDARPSRNRLINCKLVFSVYFAGFGVWITGYLFSLNRSIFYTNTIDFEIL